MFNKFHWKPKVMSSRILAKGEPCALQDSSTDPCLLFCWHCLLLNEMIISSWKLWRERRARENELSSSFLYFYISILATPQNSNWSSNSRPEKLVGAPDDIRKGVRDGVWERSPVYDNFMWPFTSSFPLCCPFLSSCLFHYNSFCLLSLPIFLSCI